jgi:uracil-DNA glycosylase
VATTLQFKEAMRLRSSLFSAVALVALASACSGQPADGEADGASDEASAVKACSPILEGGDPAAGKRLWSRIPRPWQEALGEERGKPYLPALASFVEAERAGATPIYPTDADTFTALQLTDPNRVNVVILGQDPYINEGQAHGLAFSVKAPSLPPPSLKNIFIELADDVPDIKPVTGGSLIPWAQQNVLLLNAVLTVRDGVSNSHACHGWEELTDAVIRTLSARPDPLVFVLWGAFAQSKARLIDPRHTIITGAHPSPLSARRGFFGSRPFSKVNSALRKQGKPEIDWQLPDEG